MTERMVEELRSDVWGVGKSDFTEYTPEEELKAWREAVKVLDGFCQVADALMLDPLILALVDAKVRAEEELERVQDRTGRPEDVKVSPREGERLQALMRRADALANACAAMEDWSSSSPEYVARYLSVLREIRIEAHEAFLRYRREVSLPEKSTA